MDGLINGVESKAAKLEKAMKSIAESVIKETKNIYDMGSPSQVFTDIGSNLMTSLAGGAKGASGVVSKTLSSVLGGAFGTGKMSMPVSVSAMPVQAGNQVTFGDVYLSERIDLATLKSYVQQMILER
jgi:hypothetical protein